MALEDALLDILACPIDKRGLLYFADDAVLYNPRLRRLYRIEDDIPRMLPGQAEPVPDEEHSRLMKCARLGQATVTAGEAGLLADGRWPGAVDVTVRTPPPRPARTRGRRRG